MISIKAKILDQIELAAARRERIAARWLKSSVGSAPLAHRMGTAAINRGKTAIICGDAHELETALNALLDFNNMPNTEG